MRDEIFGNTGGEIKNYEIDNLGLVAAAFDEFELEPLINSAIGKVGSHVVVDSGALIKLLVMQQLNVPYQSLSGTEEYYENRPVGAFLNQDISSEHLGRGVLARLLDALHEYGGQKLFLECSERIVKKLDVRIEEVHIDSSSFHYDGKQRIEEGCNLELKLGYSRDHRPELIQAIMLMLADGQSKLPVYSQNLSGNIQDKSSFAEVVRTGIPILKEQYRELKYLVGDSALCTAASFKATENKDYFLVTRVPDTHGQVKRCMAETRKEELIPIFPDDLKSPLGKWVDEFDIDGVKVKALLVNNEELRGQKEKTVRKHAEKELERLTSKLKKLRTQSLSTREDAEKQVNKIIASAKLCTVSDVCYEEVTKNANKGRPKKNEPIEIKVVGVKVTANVEIDEERLEKRIHEEIKYVLATNDVKREWTMSELLTVYKRNSVIERNWKCLKNPKFFVDALYLQKPSRIDALLWIMSIALLVYTAMEYKIRQSMKAHSLAIPSIVKGRIEEQPTLMRMLQYIANQHISLVKLPNDTFYICNMSPQLKEILIALGPTWCRYFNSNYYEGKI